MSYLTKQPAGTQTSRSIENFLRLTRRLLGSKVSTTTSARVVDSLIEDGARMID